MPDFSEEVGRFGRLAIQILDEPIWRNFVEDPDLTGAQFLERICKCEPTNDALASTVEYERRTLAGEGPLTCHLIHQVLDQQAPESSTSPKDIAALHELLCFEAMKQRDWLKAILHLGKMEELWKGVHVPVEDENRLFRRYGKCYDQLEKGEECARYVFQAYDLIAAKDPTNEDEVRLLLLSVVTFKSLEYAL
jgi:hypothetical protein